MYEVDVIDVSYYVWVRGAVVGRGLNYFQEGIDTGRIAVGILNGELDIASTAISRQKASSLAVNLDAAAAQGVSIPDSLLEIASSIIENGEIQTIVVQAPDLRSDEFIQASAEFLASLECSPQLIEEQLKALEDND